MISFHINHYPEAIVTIIISVITVVAGLKLLKKILTPEGFRDCQEVEGNILQVIGTLYAVILGLVVSDAMSNFFEAHQVMSQESTALISVYSLSDQITNTHTADEIKKASLEYVDEVLQNDWVMMANDEYNYAARNKLVQLLNLVKKVEPVTENEKAVLPIMLQNGIDLINARRTRVDAAMIGIPSLEWWFLIVGAIVTIISSYLYAFDSERAHLIAVGLLAFAITLNLFIVLFFGEPYKGDFQVTNKALHTARNFMLGAYFSPDLQ